MGRLASTFECAVAAHREALAHLAAAKEGVPDGRIDPAIEQLDRRLAAQHERLAHLGGALGRHVGSRPVPAGGHADPAQAARLARQSADAADAAAAEVERLAEQPTLLPGLSPVARNLVVYATCAFVAVAGQYTLIGVADAGRIDTLPLLAWVCAGLPVLAFLVGYLVIAVWGSPRLAAGAVARHPLLGLAICFLALPAVYCGYKLAVSVG